MSQIVTHVCEELGGVEMSCITIKGDTWFKGIDVAHILSYTYASDAVKDHVPLKFKHKLKYLHEASDFDVYELNSSWISEAGVHKLILKSRADHAEVFQEWFCSDVLPSIRKAGGHNSKYPYRRDNITNDEVQTFANGREDRLHYDIVEHIKTRYPDAVLHAGLGEHLTTLHARIDATYKGYKPGQPDITILKGLPNGFQDVLAIEVKNPNGTGILDARQIEYHTMLKDNCNIKAIVGCNYEEIIISIHDHYKEVLSRALTDEPKTLNFATNDNPQYWCNKLKNHSGFQEECEKRGLSKYEFSMKTKREIASILITFDKNHN